MIHPVKQQNIVFLKKFLLIIVSNVPNLMIQGQAMNIINGNGLSNRQQWSGTPRRTILNVLERARVKDDTMSSTIDNNETSDISLINLAKRIDPERKNETYVVVESSNSSCEILNKPIISDLVVEDFDSTLTNQSKLLENRRMSISDDFDLLEGLTTGHFDAKNKLVRKSFISFGFLLNITISFVASTNSF